MSSSETVEEAVNSDSAEAAQQTNHVNESESVDSSTQESVPPEKETDAASPASEQQTEALKEKEQASESKYGKEGMNARQKATGLLKSMPELDQQETVSWNSGGGIIFSQLCELLKTNGIETKGIEVKGMKTLSQTQLLEHILLEQ